MTIVAASSVAARGEVSGSGFRIGGTWSGVSIAAVSQIPDIGGMLSGCGGAET
jgi:hypothetical protein